MEMNNFRRACAILAHETNRLFPTLARNPPVPHVSVIPVMARNVYSNFLTAAIAATALAMPGVAQTTNPADKAAPGSPILNPRTQESEKLRAPKRTRAVSSGVAAALAAAVPKYTPPPPKPEPTPESEAIDLRDIDKPKNTIIRLPKYIVQEQKPIVFSERAITTDKGLADIAVRRYISDVDRALNRFTLPLFGISAEARALAMYAEDERLRNMSDLNDAAANAAKSDPAAGAYIRRETQETFMRTSDFGWSSGDPR